MRIHLRSQPKAVRILLGGGGLLLFIALAIVNIFGYNQLVTAFSGNDRIGPNPNWYGHSARFTLENDANVAGSGSMIIPVFITNTGAPEDAPQFPSQNVNIRLFDYALGYIGGSLSYVRITYKSTYNDVTHSCSNSTTSWSTVGSSDRNFTIDRRCFVYRSDINAWYSNMTATLYNNSGIINFRTQITSPTSGNELFGYDASTSKFAIGARYRCDYSGDRTGCNQYYNYAIPFGTPCSESSAHYAYAYIYDPDNPSGSSIFSIQPRGFGVRVTDTTNPAAPTVEVPYVTGSGGNGGTYTVRFTVKPSHKYLFNINGVYTNNVLQFRLPYDSIEYIANCAWNVEPKIDVNASQVEPPVNTINVSPVVDNLGPGAAGSVKWQLTRCTVPRTAPAAAYSKAADNASDGRTTYNALGASCQELATATSGFVKGSTPVGTLTNQSIGAEQVGTRICYVLSVNPPTNLSAANVWRHSTPKCVLIVKKPKVQITGNDLIVGTGSAQTKNVVGATSQKDASGVIKTYGSWVEYGIVASGLVQSVASGAGYSGGSSSSRFCDVSLLTFTNATTSGPSSVCQDAAPKGQYTTVKRFPNISARMSTKTAVAIPGAGIDVGAVGTGIYTTNAASLTVSSSATIAKGKWVVIYAPNATVTMAGNINYTSELLQSAADIPQVLIIANSIDIQGGVTNLDAWLIASGTQGVINTCSDVAVAAALTDSICGNKLVVNGPAVSKELYLRRTAGSSSGEAAENFNLRPDAYLWATEWSSGSGRLQTVYSKELPPRF